MWLKTLNKIFCYSAFFFALVGKTFASENCISCHKDVVDSWLQSDHAKAMDIVSDKTVLGDFNNANLSYFQQRVEFFKDNNKFKAKITDESVTPAKVTEYQIDYVFGHYPLQQYLVDMPDGKKQVFPFTWDSRSKEEGGQRWYHIHSQEYIQEQDRLHWLQPLQNWNGMCADCHSDGLKRNYNPVKDAFESKWDNINIGCVSCHTVDAKHADDNYQSTKTIEGVWQFATDAKIAQWHSLNGKPRDNQFMDNCYACHALRSPLTDGITANNPFLDQFLPEFLVPPLYYADGQIKEEVYVHGSFKQSKMFEAGVNCIDCHDPHTYKIKSDTNGLCLQCHEVNTYNVEQHHKHPIGSEGAECVSCHMPTTTYMGVDARRDHSFSIPRPHLSDAFATPNACVSCHAKDADGQNKTNQWAAKQIEKWFGHDAKTPAELVQYMQIHAGQASSLDQHLALAANLELDVMKRATLIRMLAYYFPQVTAKQLTPFVKNDDPLIRIAAAQVASLVPATERTPLIQPLLQDKLKAVRVAAAQALIDAKVDGKTFKQAFDEYNQFMQINSWRAEGRLNYANDLYRQGEVNKALEQFKRTTEIEPYFAPGYVNLADIYRNMQQDPMVEKVLKQGLTHNPNSADIHYSYALHLIRIKQYQQALTHAEQAYTNSFNPSQYLYTYTLLMDNLGQTNQALQKLWQHKNDLAANRDLKDLALYMAQKLNNRMMYQRINAL
ncbi:multiheme c-type cytochrome [Catenovulum sp. SX2]|uniref:multiheme c-type cytochrome n=1 Tax=Catenovulum sp. SX2 TaxID=3398614 RepID=UPI003F8666EC